MKSSNNSPIDCHWLPLKQFLSFEFLDVAKGKKPAGHWFNSRSLGNQWPELRISPRQRRRKVMQLQVRACTRYEVVSLGWMEVWIGLVILVILVNFVIVQTISGWWFGTWFLYDFMTFHILGIIIPTDWYFSEGLKPPTRYILMYFDYWLVRLVAKDICIHLYSGKSSVTQATHSNTEVLQWGWVIMSIYSRRRFLFFHSLQAFLSLSLIAGIVFWLHPYLSHKHYPSHITL